MENLVRSPKGSPEMEEMVKNVGREIDSFVRRRWVESEWETAWFFNPPVSERRACHHRFAKRRRPAEATERSRTRAYTRVREEEIL